jgi:hypothetical protein
MPPKSNSKSGIFSKLGRRNSKRNRSGQEEDRDTKREKVHESSSSDSSQNVETLSLVMDDTDFINKMFLALSNDRIKSLLREPTDELKQIINEKMTKVEKRVTKVEERVNTLEKKVDEYEQRDRENHFILSGKDTLGNDTSKDAIAALLRVNLEIDLEANDIKYIMKLGKDGAETKRMRVVLNDPAKKSSIMTAKNKLKGKMIWVQDDLTLYRSNLAFLARKAVKEKKIQMTWVTGNKVFIKPDEESAPKRVNLPSEIPS